jgi:hypothetical protein
MLWENWRLTRVETLWRLAIGILFSVGLLHWFAAEHAVLTRLRAAPVPPPPWLVDVFSPRSVLFWLMIISMLFPIAVAKLNGGRLIDGYRPGYPFYVLYTRPVRTAMLVGAPMAYNAVLCAVVYLVQALILSAVSGESFPLLPLAGWLLAWHVVQWAVHWGSTRRVVQWTGSIVMSAGFAALLWAHLLEWPARFGFSSGEYAAMAGVALVSFALAVAGVARQRRGDTQGAAPRTLNWGVSDRLASLLWLPCPTSSATRAQIWFELKSGGLPVLMIGVALAIVIPLLFLVASRLDGVLSGPVTRPLIGLVEWLAVLLSPLAVLLLGGNAFGIRARQGKKYASAFQAIQACTTVRMAGLKVLLRTLSVLGALAAVTAGVWTAAHLISFGTPAKHPLIGLLRAEDALAALRPYEQLALAVVVLSGVALMVALRASLEALRARHPRLMSIAQGVLLAWVCALYLLLNTAHHGSSALSKLAAAVLGPSRWLGVAALALATACLLWRVLVEGLLTRLAAGLAFLASAAFAAAWVTLLQARGVTLDAMPAAVAVWQLQLALLPPLICLLAPWSLGQVRHA